MKGKPIIFVSIAIIIIAITVPVVYQIIRKKTDPNYPIFAAVGELQKAVRENNAKKRWELISRVEREYYDNDYVSFENDYAEWSKVHPEDVALYINTRLGKIINITPERVWVECSSSGWLMGFHMVKENDKWKFGNHLFYIKTIKRDFDLLQEAIKKFYADKENIPYNLSELIPDYIEILPHDPFSVDGKPYGYETTGDTSWRIYSIGIDGYDDLGIIGYDLRMPKYTNYRSFTFTKGDIYRDDSIG